ncbi:MAG: hypothetical protein ACTSVV_03765 [Promethearchaeota archaeon]
MSTENVFDFKEEPKLIEYLEKEPMKLHKGLFFFHNKAKFRKDLIPLQFLFRDYVGVALHAAGIRDSYIRDSFSEEYLLVILTEHETIKSTDKIVEERQNVQIDKGCYYIEGNTNYIILMTKDMEGLHNGLKTFETILEQTFNNYFETKNFDDYVKVPCFKLYHCAPL